MSAALRDALELGRAAAVASRPISSCPFEWRSLESVSWEQGWLASTLERLELGRAAIALGTGPCVRDWRGAVSPSRDLRNLEG